jgi:hypothetical protein
MNRRKEHAERVKQEDEEALHLQELDNRIRRALQQVKHSSIPPKRRTKTSGKATPNSFDQNLKGVPGGGRYGFSWAVLQRMADHPDTGTRIASLEQEIRLKLSEENSYTTRGNYIV